MAMYCRGYDSHVIWDQETFPWFVLCYGLHSWDKTPYSHTASLHEKVQIFAAELLGKFDKILGVICDGPASHFVMEGK